MAFLSNVVNDLLSQGWIVIFSIFALILNVIGYQQKTKRAILITIICAMATVSVYYGLSGQWAGAVMNILSIVRSLIFDQRDRGRSWAQSRLYLAGFIVVFLLAGAYTGIANKEGWLAMLTVLGMTLATISMWVKKPKTVRFLSLPAMICWFVYNFSNGLWLLLLSDIMCITSIIIAIVRYDIVPRFLKQNNDVFKGKRQ